MPTFDELYKYHSFTKAPAAAGLTIGQSVNKAGHTVTAQDVWAEPLPYMYSVTTVDDLADETPDLNDLAYAGATKKYYQYDGSSWVDITDSIKTTKLKNADGNEVLQFHSGNLTVLDNDNNAGVTSNGESYRFFIDGKPVQRFVAATDSIDSTGFPSLGYNVIVTKNTKTSLLDGTDFYADYYGGTIFFTSAQKSSDTFQISLFEYIGKAVSEALGGTIVDNREGNITENDLWGHNVTKTKDFTRVGHDYLSSTSLSSEWKENIAKVSNNKAFNANDEFVSHIETNMIVDGSNMFGSSLTSFSGSLENLTTASGMFQGSAITDINTSFKSLYNASEMFKNSSLKEFNVELPAVVNTNSMFEECANLTNFTSNMPYVISGTKMFKDSGLASFSGAAPYLFIGTDMFKNSSVSDINCAFSALITGIGMFENTSLTEEAVKCISQSIPKINSLTVNEDNEECFFFENGYTLDYLTHAWDSDSKSLISTPAEFNVSGNDIGEITITWKVRDALDFNERLIVIREHFKWMQLKGWTIISNINDALKQEEVVTNKIWGRVREVPASEATHTTTDGKNVIILTASNVYPGIATIQKPIEYTWFEYDSIENLISTLQLTSI